MDSILYCPTTVRFHSQLLSPYQAVLLCQLNKFYSQTDCPILGHLNSCNHTSNDDENGFLRNCWIVFQDTHKSKSFYVYDNLKDKFPITGNNWERLREFIVFLEKAALTYRQLYTRENVALTEEKQCLIRLGYQPALASVLPLILAIYNRETETSNRIALCVIQRIVNDLKIITYCRPDVCNRLIFRRPAWEQ